MPYRVARVGSSRGTRYSSDFETIEQAQIYVAVLEALADWHFIAEEISPPGDWEGSAPSLSEAGWKTIEIEESPKKVNWYD